MPSALHGELADAAEREGMSLNQLIVGRLSRSVDGAAAEPEPGPPHRRNSRLLTYTLAVNLVVLLVAGAIAVVLLVVAWKGL